MLKTLLSQRYDPHASQALGPFNRRMNTVIPIGPVQESRSHRLSPLQRFRDPPPWPGLALAIRLYPVLVSRRCSKPGYTLTGHSSGHWQSSASLTYNSPSQSRRFFGARIPRFSLSLFFPQLPVQSSRHKAPPEWRIQYRAAMDVEKGKVTFSNPCSGMTSTETVNKAGNLTPDPTPCHCVRFVSHFSGEISSRHADIILLLCTLISGLVDSAMFDGTPVLFSTTRNPRSCHICDRPHGPTPT